VYIMSNSPNGDENKIQNIKEKSNVVDKIYFMI